MHSQRKRIMAKQVTPVIVHTFNINDLVAATTTAFAAKATVPQAEKAAFDALKGKGQTTATLVDRWFEAMALKAAVDATFGGIAAGLALTLKTNGVNVAEKPAVADALRVTVWQRAGHAEPMATKGEKGTAHRAEYQRVAQILSRMVARIVEPNKPKAQRVKAKVICPKVFADGMKSMKDDGMTKQQALELVKRIFG